MTPPSDSVLVIDVGSSNVRSAIMRPDGTLTNEVATAVPPRSPSSGLVEYDALAMAQAALGTARAALGAGGPVGAVGIANQRATTVVWDRQSGQPVAPAIGWQDLRTVGTCLALQEEGLRLAPNASATKLAAILDDVDPARANADNLCFGTIDSWVAWTLTGGAAGGRLHVTDGTNVAVTTLRTRDQAQWDERVLKALRIPPSMLPEVVDSSGAIGEAVELEGKPVVSGLVGDQQASLIGQGGTRPGLAKATFGTGAMLDLCTGDEMPTTAGRLPAGTFPIVTWQLGGIPTFGVEAIMLSAGSCIAWLHEDLGLIDNPAASAAVAGICDDPGDVWFVPAHFGMATPVWDFGARSLLIGLTRGTGRPELVRAVLRGIAHRGADLLEAAEADGHYNVPSLRVDGGMSANDVFLQELADAIGRPVDVSRVVEATTLGGGFLAGMAIGTWKDLATVGDLWSPGREVTPTPDVPATKGRRERWLEARARAERTLPELSGISF